MTLTARDFSFSGSWYVDAPPARVQEVLLDLEHYPDWWPQVRAVASLGDDDALVVCRSVLPYSLDLHLHALHRDPHHLETTIGGDLEGEVRWLITPEGEGTLLSFEQEVRVRSLALALASYVVRPLLAWNHHRMMRSCLEGLARTVGGQAHATR